MLEFVRRARDSGAEVRVVMTAAAQEFVTPLSFQALSGHPVHCELLDAAAEAGMGHIELARWAEQIVVAPASADFMARLRSGMADDLATTVCLASAAPLLLVPAMNQQMWRNAATQENYQALKSRGIDFIGPASGSQACGDVGPGRMVEIAEILDALAASRSGDVLSGLKVLITAGPTQEPIDPVRYISNRSSGKMGYAIANAARRAGATVTLVTGPTKLTVPEGVDAVSVITAAEMFDAVMECASAQDIFVSTAAVADYTIEDPSNEKRKKSQSALELTLQPTQDILKAVAALENPPFTVGFAAETQNVRDNARAKMVRKGLSMIAANDVSDARIGFDSDENELEVYWTDGEKRLEVSSKENIARQLVMLIAERFRVETNITEQ